LTNQTGNQNLNSFRAWISIDKIYEPFRLI